MGQNDKLQRTVTGRVWTDESKPELTETKFRYLLLQHAFVPSPFLPRDAIYIFIHHQDGSTADIRRLIKYTT